jgi:hypothetical protein
MKSVSTIGLLVGLSLGCDRPTAGEDSADPPSLQTDSGAPDDGPCEGTPPVVEDVWCLNTGIKPHYETGEDTATMQLWAAASDVDGDLTSYVVQIFYDDEVDESVDTSVIQFNPVYGSVEYDNCTATDAELGLTLYLTGEDPDYDTPYDWGIIVTDAYGLDSEVYVSTCWTPTSDGSDGGTEKSDTGG